MSDPQHTVATPGLQEKPGRAETQFRLSTPPPNSTTMATFVIVNVVVFVVFMYNRIFPKRLPEAKFVC